MIKSLKEVKQIKFDFTEISKLDQNNNLVLTAEVKEKLFQQFKEIYTKNLYISKNQQPTAKLNNLPIDAKVLDFDEKVEVLLINNLVYILAKYGSLKFGPIIYVCNSENGTIWADLSHYAIEGNKNKLSSIFDEPIADLNENENFFSNFYNFCLTRGIKPKNIKTKRILFPRSFTLYKGYDRARLRRDMQVLFDWLMTNEKALPSLTFLEMEACD